jgi:hypothetical protein
MIFRYAPEDKTAAAKPVESIGVSNLLSGNPKPLIPADNPRHERRKKKLLAVVTAEATAAGVPARDGTAVTPKRVTRKSAAPLGGVLSETTNGSHAAPKNGAPANGRKPKLAVPPPVPATSHPTRPLIGGGKTNGKALGIAAAAKKRG